MVVVPVSMSRASFTSILPPATVKPRSEDVSLSATCWDTFASVKMKVNLRVTAPAQTEIAVLRRTTKVNTSD